MVSECFKIIVATRDEVSALLSELRNLRAEAKGYQGPEGKIAQAHRKMEDELKAIRSQVSGVRNRINVTREEEGQKVQERRRELFRKERANKAKAKEYGKELGALAKRVEELKSRLKLLRRRTEAAGVEAEVDGKVISSSPALKLAVIDIGRKDLLVVGTTFKVFALRKGKRVPKGTVKVIKVMQTMSQAKVESLVHPRDPIEVGDILTSPQFDRTRVRTFAIAGYLVGRFSKDELRSILKEYGGTVVDRVDLNTTYVVVGRGYRKSENFKKAVQLGVRIIRERELYDILGLSWE
jgi:NAD-dependent DNA ligase